MHGIIDLLLCINELDMEIFKDINQCIYRSNYIVHMIKNGRYLNYIWNVIQLSDVDLLQIDKAII